MLSISPEVATALAIRLVQYLEPIDSGCILSHYHVNPVTGYSSIATGTRGRVASYYAHRVMYTHIVGPIPDGLTIDHLCRVHNCVNPAHLEPVTLYENIQRRVYPPRTRPEVTVHVRATVCAKGHEFTTGPNGVRFCKVCKKARDAARPFRSHHAARALLESGEV